VALAAAGSAARARARTRYCLPDRPAAIPGLVATTARGAVLHHLAARVITGADAETAPRPIPGSRCRRPPTATCAFATPNQRATAHPLGGGRPAGRHRRRVRRGVRASQPVRRGRGHDPRAQTG